jgi:hypothetical protein
LVKATIKTAPSAATDTAEYGAACGVLQARRKSSQNHSPRERESLYLAATDPADSARTMPAMNAPSELNFEEMLRIRLEVLRREHRDLDEAVHVLETAGRPDQLTLRRLKKQKLALKDQIVKIEDQLIPDIIA